MIIKDIASENRPRERLFFKGSDALSDAELLAVILQNGSKGENVIDLSNRLIKEHGMDSLNSLSVSELSRIKGIGVAKASKVVAAFELSKRVNAGRICEKVINSSADIAEHYMEKMKDLKKEHLVAVFLDSKNKIIRDEVISIGTLDSSLVHPREVFKEAIRASASAIILVHNHPSLDAKPSENDLIVTKRLAKSADILNIKIMDHIIISNNGWDRIGIKYD